MLLAGLPDYSHSMGCQYDMIFFAFYGSICNPGGCLYQQPFIRIMILSNTLVPFDDGDVKI
jgi:hypothetical protein